MSLGQYTEEQLKEMSMVELAHEILEQRKEAMAFSEIVKEVRAILELTDEELAARISQFYTDMNIDGRFLCISEGRWGLKVWYPYEQIEEEVLPQAKPKKKRGKKVEVVADLEELDDYEEDEFEEYDSFEEDELDDLDEDEELEEELIEEEFDLEEDEIEEELEELELEELDEE